SKKSVSKKPAPKKLAPKKPVPKKPVPKKPAPKKVKTVSEEDEDSDLGLDKKPVKPSKKPALKKLTSDNNFLAPVVTEKLILLADYIIKHPSSYDDETLQAAQLIIKEHKEITTTIHEYFAQEKSIEALSDHLIDSFPDMKSILEKSTELFQASVKSVVTALNTVP
ncbi:MAG: hypothetical protein HYS39_03040, partial [Proteobacteria bacterium]|nr:hypothetical protein [Pseudomonadota bacterium]